MAMDGKNLAALIASGPAPKPKTSTDTEEMSGAQDDGAGLGGDSEGDEGEGTAAQEMLDAMKSGDVHGFAEALKSFVEMCMSKY